MHEFTTYLKTEGYSQSTIAYHIKVMGKFRQWTERENLELQEISYTDVLGYVKYCQQQGTGKTGISRYLTAIRNFYKYQISIDAMQGNPAESVRLQGLNRKKLYDILTPTELSVLYQKYTKQPYLDEWKHSRNVAIAGLVFFSRINYYRHQTISAGINHNAGRSSKSTRQ